MPQGNGKTYGFGRVSTEARPSPYTPVHLPSVSPSIGAPERTLPQKRSTRRRRWAGVVTLVVVAAASAFAAAGFLRAAPRPVQEAGKAADATLLVQDDEAGRLARSAIAVVGGAPRR